VTGAVVRERSCDVAVNGLTLRVTRWSGGDPPLVLLHGGGLSGRTWSRVVEMLPDHRCVAPDLRGHGDSDWSAESAYRIADFVADLDELVAAAGLNRFALVGHSLGGLVALSYASRCPQRLVGLVVVDTGLRYLASEGARVRGLLASGPFPSLDAAVASVRSVMPHRDEESLRQGLRRGLTRLVDGSWDWRADQRFRRDPDLRQCIGDDRRRVRDQLMADPTVIGCPTLVVRGGDSDVLTAQGADELVSGLPNARLVEVPGAGHNVHRERPVELAGHIAAFLAMPGRP
jgi:pimeloyl-ACP methyl ester carboxylesterase